MSIQIIKQDYENECGICVLLSMHKHFYNDSNLSKEQLIEIADMSVNGISLYELQQIGEKINLDIEIFEMDFKTLLNENNFNHFITCIKTSSNNHFVIVKRYKSYFEMYDTDQKVYKFSYEEFFHIFTGIYITVNKKIINLNPIEITNNKKYFFDFENNYPFITLSIFTDLFTLFLSILANSFIKVIIDKIIPLKLNNELIYFCLFFIICFSLMYSISYINNLFKIYMFEKIFKKQILIYTKILKNKNNLFFNKFKKEIIYEYPTALFSIINQKYFLFPNLISESITSLTLVVIILFNCYFFIIPILINLLIIITFGVIKSKYNNNNYENLHINKNKIEVIYNDFINFIINEKNDKALNTIEKDWHNEIYKYQHYCQKNNLNNNLLSFLDNSISKLVFVLFISICSSIIINQYFARITISTIIYLSSLLNMLINSLNDIFNYWSGLSIHKKNLQLIKDFELINNNMFNDQGLLLKKIKSIKLNNLNFKFTDKHVFKNKTFKFTNGNLIIGKNGIGKSTLFKILALKYLCLESYFINDLNINKYNIKHISNNVIYLPSDPINISNDFIFLINKSLTYKTLITEILKMTQLDINKTSFSKGEKQLINLLNILDSKNKIILLDESCSNIHESLNEIIYKKIKDQLEKNNFVLWINHNKSIHKYFKKKVVIHG